MEGEELTDEDKESGKVRLPEPAGVGGSKAAVGWRRDDPVAAQEEAGERGLWRGLGCLRELLEEETIGGTLREGREER